MAERLDYRDTLVLAPMVRVGTLPMRLLALEYGADIVYTEETIDKKLIGCDRVVNDALGTVDYVHEGKGGHIVFRTSPKERGRVVMQIGTADAALALKAAQAVEKDVAAIDVNMGCPKKFSVCGGMGSALLSRPETVREIVTTLARNLSVPVTCKIRLKDRIADSIDLARIIEGAGAAALAVHARRVGERPRDPPRLDELAAVCAAVSLPVIANGDIWTREDARRVREQTGAASAMFARAAQENPSVFRREGPLPGLDVVKKYVRKAVECDTFYQNTKYVVMPMLRAAAQGHTPLAEAVPGPLSLLPPPPTAARSRTRARWPTSAASSTARTSAPSSSPASPPAARPSRSRTTRPRKWAPRSGRGSSPPPLSPRGDPRTAPRAADDVT